MSFVDILTTMKGGGPEHRQLTCAPRQRLRGGGDPERGQQVQQPVCCLRRQQQPAPGQPRPYLQRACSGTLLDLGCNAVMLTD